MMIVELFNIWHFAIMICGAGMITGAYFLLRHKSEKTKYLVILVIAILNLSMLTYRTVRISFEPWFNILEFLPLHLCNFFIVLDVFALVFKSKTLYHFIYYMSVPGGLAAIIVPTDSFLHATLISEGNMIFYLNHILLIGIGILIYALGLFRIERKKALISLGMLMVYFCICHIVNLSIAAATANAVAPNYMFTVNHYGNPLLVFFYNLIPVPLVYLFPASVILIFTMTLQSLPQLLKEKNLRKKTVIR